MNRVSRFKIMLDEFMASGEQQMFIHCGFRYDAMKNRNCIVAQIKKYSYPVRVNTKDATIILSRVDKDE